MSNPQLERLLSIVLVASVASVAGVALVREVRTPPPGEDDRRVLRAERIETWRDAKAYGTDLADKSAPITVTVFNDLECGGCSRYHREIVDSLITDGSVSVTFFHRPLRGHRFSRTGSIAAECAGEQGRFLPFVSRVLAQQDSIGFKSWLTFAFESGVGVETEFVECLGRSDIHERVDKAVAFADKLGVNATPTVMINEWLLNRIPVGDELQEAVEAVRAGRRPGAN